MVAPWFSLSISEMFPINFTDGPIRNTASSLRTCPSNSRPPMCVSHFGRLFCSALYILVLVPITTLPQPPPSPKALRGCSLCDWHLINEEGLVSLITVTVSERTSELIYLLSLGKTLPSIKKFTFLLPVAIKEPVLF